MKTKTTQAQTPKAPVTMTAGEAGAAALEKARIEAQAFIDEQVKTVTKFKDEAANGSVTYAAQWKLMDAMIAEECQMTYVHHICQAITGQAAPKTTWVELADALRDEVKDAERRLLTRSDFMPNSTCPISNLANLAKTQAMQETRKIAMILEWYIRRLVLMGTLAIDAVVEAASAPYMG